MKAHRAELDGQARQIRPQAARLRDPLVGAHPGRGLREAKARAMEEHYLDSIPPEAGLIELSSMYGLDFSILGATCGSPTSPPR